MAVIGDYLYQWKKARLGQERYKVEGGGDGLTLILGHWVGWLPLFQPGHAT